MSSRRRRGLLSLALVLGLAPALAPAVLAAGLTLTTPYPSVVVSPGTQVSFELSVETTNATRVNLSVGGAPASWTASLYGGGFVISAVETNGDDPTTVRLDVDVPADATGSARITVTADDGDSTVTLPLDIKVEADAAGEVTVKPDYTALRGTSNQSMTFNLSINNQTPGDLSYTATGEGPVGWTVDVTLTGQAQAVSGTVKANGTSNAAVKVTPAENAEAGTYPIAVVVTVGGQQYPVELSVEVTGSYSMIVTTPTTVLSASGNAGAVMEQQFEIRNTGTAAINNVVMTGNLPTNWKVEFDPGTTESIAAGSTATITARITPAADAIAGDYSLTFTARGDEASDQVDIRFTVETSIVGGVVGGLLILAAVGGLWWVFRRYGRR